MKSLFIIQFSSLIPVLVCHFEGDPLINEVFLIISSKKKKKNCS